MHVLLLAALLAAPFWETKPVRQWTDEQLLELLSDSPWAQTTLFRNDTPLPVYLATAKPVREAESEWLRRYTSQLGANAPTDMGARHEYEAFLAENLGKVLVIAIRNPNLRALALVEETERMEEESFLKAGKKKLKVIGHFPPAAADPVLRLIFPKPEEAVKDLQFELYIPGVSGPYRQAVFKIKDLMFAGQPEM